MIVEVTDGSADLETLEGLGGAKPSARRARWALQGRAIPEPNPGPGLSAGGRERRLLCPRYCLRSQPHQQLLRSATQFDNSLMGASRAGGCS